MCSECPNCGKPQPWNGRTSDGHRVYSCDNCSMVSFTGGAVIGEL